MLTSPRERQTLCSYYPSCEATSHVVSSPKTLIMFCTGALCFQYSSWTSPKKKKKKRVHLLTDGCRQRRSRTHLHVLEHWIVTCMTSSFSCGVIIRCAALRRDSWINNLGAKDATIYTDVKWCGRYKMSSVDLSQMKQTTVNLIPSWYIEIRRNRLCLTYTPYTETVRRNWTLNDEMSDILLRALAHMPSLPTFFCNWPLLLP